MKKIVSFAILLAIQISVLYGQKISQKEYKLSDYSKIKVSSSLDVKLVASDKEGVTLKCDERLIPGIKIEKSGQVLEIGLDWDKLDDIAGSSFFNRSVNISKDKVKINGKIFKGGINIVVYVKQISEITASSSGDVYWEGNLPANKLNINSSSSGDIKWTGVLKADLLNIKCSSSGDVTGDFEGEKSSIKISSSGDYNGNLHVNLFDAHISSSGDYKGELNAQTASFDLSSSGNATVSGNIDNLRVHASSSADFYGRKIVYKNADVKTSSSARIYLSKSGNLRDNTERKTGVIIE